MASANGSRCVVLARRPVGNPQAGDFKILDTVLEAPKPGELLIESRWLSIDPMLAIIMAEQPLNGAFPPLPIGEVVPAAAVSVVLESGHRDFQPGDWVEGRTGWRERGCASASAVRRIDPAQRFHALGFLGLPGFSAWCGLQLAGDLTGKTVLVSGAAGAVGSAAGQLARLTDAHVIGIAGSETKCRYLKDIGYDVAINRRSPDFVDRLTPLENEVDVYFDNVGGALLEKVLPTLTPKASIIVCGIMSNYTRIKDHGLHALLNATMAKTLTIKGFNNREFLARQHEFEQMATPLLESGALRDSYDVKDGLEGAIAHISAMFSTDVIGKRIAGRGGGTRSGRGEDRNGPWLN